MQHREPDGHEPTANPSVSGQWFITDMAAPVDGTAATHAETDATTIEGIIPLDLVHEVQVSFTE